VTDGQTDRQKWSSYYSALHCEQCGRAVNDDDDDDDDDVYSPQLKQRHATYCGKSSGLM